MTFLVLKKLLKEQLGIDRLADIARELDVTPQVVSNWKSRDQVPYKYVKLIRKKIKKDNKPGSEFSSTNQLYGQPNYFNFPFYSPADKNIADENAKSLTDLVKYVFGLILKRKFLFFAIQIVIILLSSIDYFFYTKPVYVATSKILPTSGNNPSSIGGLAQQFGINVGGGGSDQTSSLYSSEMFPDVIKSRRLSINLLDKKFNTQEFGKDVSLINIILKNGDKKKWSIISRRKATSRLLKMFEVSSNKKTPLIILKVYTNESQFSADLNSAIITELTKLISSFRLSQVRDKKDFINIRMKEVLKDLTLSEDNLKIFRDQNRKILSSPSLLLEEARLIREVEVQTQIYITLKTEHEMAQIEEIERSGLLQVLDFPEAPTNRISPASYIFILILTTVFSSVFGFAVILIVDYVQALKKYSN